MKQKLERKTVIDAIGILDEKDGKLIMSIDGVEYDFIEDIAKGAIGTELHFKSDCIEE